MPLIRGLRVLHPFLAGYVTRAMQFAQCFESVDFSVLGKLETNGSVDTPI